MMAQLNVRVPEDLREQVKQVAKQQDISLNQFCLTAIARAVGEAQARRFFVQHARGLSPAEGRQKFLAVMEKVRK